ncbi:hypothetical protein QFC21_004428 [Naganishia friedmannii]|uniref:Uncharacterized protein n=1 Tax=Naganishia friedmannii TaxID=89922 RepID=A0ACC2VGH7_9TREE|nr:hypothetical protein QFC21_004428 [Naganishia friedmannii]
MNTATPGISTKHSIGSAGDLHDATPVLASIQGRQRRASSDDTAADSSEEGGAGRGDRVGEKQAVREDVVPAVSGPPASGPPFRKFGHKFSDPEIAPIRKVALKIIIIYVGLLTVGKYGTPWHAPARADKNNAGLLVMWLALPMYWGSFWKASTHSENLTVMILNRDSPSSTSLGSAVVTAGINNRNGNALNGSLVGRLGFFEGDVSSYPDEASVVHAVVENDYWGVVVGKPFSHLFNSRTTGFLYTSHAHTVNTDATARLQAARQIGNSTYDPRSAIGFYYAQGRMENAVNGYLVPIASSVLTQAAERWAIQSISEYLTSNTGNATAIQTLASAPRTVTSAVSYTLHNLRPFSTPTATAVTLVGQIYMLIIRILFSSRFASTG